MVLVTKLKIWYCLGCITNLLLVPPTVLPVILSALLNGGQSQPRNELMYQCLNLLRTTTRKWVAMICSINLCQHIGFSLGQRNRGGRSLHGS